MVPATVKGRRTGVSSLVRVYPAPSTGIKDPLDAVCRSPLSWALVAMQLIHKGYFSGTTTADAEVAQSFRLPLIRLFKRFLKSNYHFFTQCKISEVTGTLGSSDTSLF